MSFFLSVDLGTTGCRSIIFSRNLDPLGQSYEEYGLITAEGGIVEQSSLDWWQLTLKTAKAAIQKSGISPKDIHSLSVSSQGITLVPTDESFNPLSNAISWLDVRATAEALEIEKEFGNEKIYKITGKPIIPEYTLPKLIWLKKNEPELYSRAHKFLMPLDFLVAKFTGRAITDHTMASATLMYDLEKGSWSEEILTRFGIEKKKLPDIAYSAECVGAILPEVREELGLAEDCICALGAQDQKCAALGAGLSGNTVTLSLGTAGAITRLWEKLDTKKPERYTWCSYAKPDVFVTEGVISTACTCLRWLRDLMFQGGEYSVIDAEAKLAMERHSSLLFLPYLATEAENDRYYDKSAAFLGATLATERGDFALAVMEGVSFEVKRMLEDMDVIGKCTSLVVFGGGAKSRLWCQLIADITGLIVKIPSTTEAAGAGAAILAASAVGDTLSPLGFKDEFFPSEHRSFYIEKYKKYKRTIEKLFRKD